jgi:hypothetical protein
MTHDPPSRSQMYISFFFLLLIFWLPFILPP